MFNFCGQHPLICSVFKINEEVGNIPIGLPSGIIAEDTGLLLIFGEGFEIPLRPDAGEVFDDPNLFSCVISVDAFLFVGFFLLLCFQCFLDIHEKLLSILVGYAVLIDPPVCAFADGLHDGLNVVHNIWLPLESVHGGPRIPGTPTRACERMECHHMQSTWGRQVHPSLGLLRALRLTNGSSLGPLDLFHRSNLTVLPDDVGHAVPFGQGVQHAGVVSLGTVLDSGVCGHATSLPVFSVGVKSSLYGVCYRSSTSRTGVQGST